MAIKSSNQITFTEQKKIVEIEEWYLATNYDSGVTIENGDWGTWTKEVQVIGESKKYLWNYEKVIYSLGDPEISEPIVIGFYGKGNDGRSIENIKNYYQTTTNTNPPTSWLESVPMLDPTNKYLWNYEVIIYTDGTTTETDPAIIGAYGDSGADALDFQIYSVDGFEFSENVNSIELKTAALKAGELIESGATYQWKWWNTYEDKYENITGATSSTLVVNITDSYAFSSIKCDMTYDGIAYSDYVTLTKKTELYISAIKFFDGSNVFDQEKSYIVAYIEVYKNNNLDETKLANEYYDGNNTVLDSQIIETDITENPNYSDRVFEENEKMYFICQSSSKHCHVVLGQYNNGAWTVYTQENKYTYSNDFYTDESSNVIAISKQDVAKSAEINMEVYQDDTFISRSSATVIDLNDPIVSDVAPTNVKYGQLWLDTSTDPYTLKIYTKGTSAKYVLAEEEKKWLNSVKSTAKTFLYGDEKDLVVFDDGSITLDQSCSTVDVCYDTYTNAEVLKGKFYTESTEDDSSEVYYMASDAEITRSIVTSSTSSSIKFYYVWASKVQAVSADVSKTGQWEYFSQQNGGAVYTSIPLNGYSEGDLWVISDTDVIEYSDTYINLFSNFGAGSMLKATTSSNTFDESHWIDAMEDVTTIIANIKESFYWDNTGIKVMRRVTDSEGNITNPFYVHIDSTRMGFHSVEYENGAVKNDVEVVHVGNNSSTIQNATFEGSNGTTFNNNANFNSQIKFGSFIWKVENNGSLSLAIES